MHATNTIDILLVEDNPADVYLLKKMLHASSLQVNTLYTTDKVQEAQKALQSQHFHIALVDLSLPDSFGLDTYLGIKSSIQQIPVIILTGLNDASIALEALKEGAQDYLVKGEFNSELLSRAIQYSLERKKAEEALLVSEEKYKQMFYQNYFPSWIYDPDSLKILEVNDAAIKTYGYTKEEFLSLTLKDIRPPEEIPKLLKTLSKNKGQLKVSQHKTKNGNLLFVEVTFFPVNYLGRVASQAQIHDVTEEIELQKKLEEHQKAEKKNVAAAVLKALESDRAYLGTELHDNINQLLATTLLYLEHAQTHTETRDELISKCQDVTFYAMQEIRKLSRKLIVGDIMEIGLKKSLQELIASILLVKNMKITLNMDWFPEKKIDKELKVTLYRIVQEQLTNILKHADARTVIIEVVKKDNQIELEICDDGKGFDPDQHRKGVGITNIKSRVMIYDGGVIIESAPGRGCRLKASLQIKN